MTCTWAAFQKWYRDAAAGEWIEYHRGYLPFDSRISMDRRYRDRAAMVAGVANHVRELARQGRLVLAQRRYGDFDYGYLAKIPRIALRPLLYG